MSTQQQVTEGQLERSFQEAVASGSAPSGFAVNDDGTPGTVLATSTLTQLNIQYLNMDRDSFLASSWEIRDGVLSYQKPNDLLRWNFISLAGIKYLESVDLEETVDD